MRSSSFFSLPSLSLILSLSFSPAGRIAANFVSTTPSKHSSPADGHCTVCRGGDSVGLPERTVDFLGIGAVETCENLEETAGFFFAESNICGMAQSVGSYCGCPIDEEAACFLCQDQGNVTEPKASLVSHIHASDLIPGAPDDMVVTCELLESVLRSTQQSNGTVCQSHQTQFQNLCCQQLLDENIIMESNNTMNNNQSCKLCPNGEPVPMLDKPLKIENFSASSCLELNDLVALLDQDDQECSTMQNYGPLCGCSPIGDAAVDATGTNEDCLMCPNGEPIPYPDRSLNWFNDVKVLPIHFQPLMEDLTCEMMETIASNPLQLAEPFLLPTGTDPDFVCLSMQLKSTSCGCSSDWRQKLLTWSYRLSGILSLVGSLVIMWHVLRVSKQHRTTTYHQLVLGICVFDCVSSLAYALVGVLAPKAAGFYGSHGNDYTCSLQGFMIQMGLTSIFYNLALSVYFFLVIIHNWREAHFKKYLPLLHGLILTAGLTLAFAAIPYYRPQFGTCYLLQAPFATQSWLIVTLFYGAPVIIVVLAITLLMGVVCAKVYARQRSSNRWSVKKSMDLTRKVFWQSFFWMMAFYLTLPFVLLSYYIRFGKGTQFWIFAAAAFMAPAQGLMNAMVYFQRSRGGSAEAFAALVLNNARNFSIRFSTLTRGMSRRFSHRTMSGTSLSVPNAGLSPNFPVNCNDAMQSSFRGLVAMGDLSQDHDPLDECQNSSEIDEDLIASAVESWNRSIIPQDGFGDSTIVEDNRHQCNQSWKTWFGGRRRSNVDNNHGLRRRSLDGLFFGKKSNTLQDDEDDTECYNSTLEFWKANYIPVRDDGEDARENPPQRIVPPKPPSRLFAFQKMSSSSSFVTSPHQTG